MFKLQIIGNIGKDARVNEVNGRYSINFSVAHNRKYRNAEGTEINKTTWVDCTVWRSKEQGCKVADYLKAGTRVFIQGEPAARHYARESGEIVDVISVNVDPWGGLELLSDKKAVEGENKQEETHEETHVQADDPQQEDDLSF
ncbi:MAG: single-stranded DNA-binding protein [Bacteroidetes bacterium]|nr:single-stranded DNA-binding protein [Bacteroidota bacterium]